MTVSETWIPALPAALVPRFLSRRVTWHVHVSVAGSRTALSLSLHTLARETDRTWTSGGQGTGLQVSLLSLWSFGEVLVVQLFHWHWKPSSGFYSNSGWAFELYHDNLHECSSIKPTAPTIPQWPQFSSPPTPCPTIVPSSDDAFFSTSSTHGPTYLSQSSVSSSPSLLHHHTTSYPLEPIRSASLPVQNPILLPYATSLRVSKKASTYGSLVNPISQPQILSRTLLTQLPLLTLLHLYTHCYSTRTSLHSTCYWSGPTHEFKTCRTTEPDSIKKFQKSQSSDAGKSRTRSRRRTRSRKTGRRSHGKTHHGSTNRRNHPEARVRVVFGWCQTQQPTPDHKPAMAKKATKSPIIIPATFIRSWSSKKDKKDEKHSSGHYPIRTTRPSTKSLCSSRPRRIRLKMV